MFRNSIWNENISFCAWNLKIILIVYYFYSIIFITIRKSGCHQNIEGVKVIYHNRNGVYYFALYKFHLE